MCVKHIKYGTLFLSSITLKLLEVHMKKYKEIALDIQKNIHLNNLPQDTKLTTIDQLSVQYEVSKTTIIRALQILEIRGIVYQRRGSGIFVRRKHKPNHINVIDNFGFKNNTANLKLHNKLLKLDIVEPIPIIQDQLQTSPNEVVYNIQRLHYLDDQPLCVENTFYRKKITGTLPIDSIKTSIFQYLSDQNIIKIGFVDTYFKIIELNPELERLLEISSYPQSIQFQQTYYSTSGIPFNYSEIVYSPELSRFFLPSGSFTSI